MSLAGTFMVQMQENYILRRKRGYQRLCMSILREFEKKQVSIKFKVVFPKNDPLTDGSRAGLCQYITYDFFFKIDSPYPFQFKSRKNVFFLFPQAIPLTICPVSYSQQGRRFLKHIINLCLAVKGNTKMAMASATSVTFYQDNKNI